MSNIPFGPTIITELFVLSFFTLPTTPEPACVTVSPLVNVTLPVSVSSTSVKSPKPPLFRFDVDCSSKNNKTSCTIASLFFSKIATAFL